MALRRPDRRSGAPLRKRRRALPARGVISGDAVARPLCRFTPGPM